MLQNFHDGVAITRVYGSTDIFLTFISNPKWPEIIETLKFEPGRSYTDKADVVVRVYHMKLLDMLSDIRSGVIFGPVNAGEVLPCLCWVYFLLSFSTFPFYCLLFCLGRFFLIYFLSLFGY